MRPHRKADGTRLWFPARIRLFLVLGFFFVTAASPDDKSTHQPEVMNQYYQQQNKSYADNTTSFRTLLHEINNSKAMTPADKITTQFIEPIKHSENSSIHNNDSVEHIKTADKSTGSPELELKLSDKNFKSVANSSVKSVYSSVVNDVVSVSNISVESSTVVPVTRSFVRRDSVILDEEDPCRSFTEGDPDAKVLYSPGYPGNYPKKANCVVILEAPPGHLLRLDFRDHFDVEPSEECKFDFLEIRDGMYGFSTQIGQYCGQEFPPMVTSRDRYLWLHFESDENIEYSGFKMVYEYIPRPTTSTQPELETCVQHRSGDEGYLNRSDIPDERVRISIQHNMPLECMWIIEVPENWKIQLQFLKFELVRPNDCDINFVDIYPERTDIPHQIAKYCGSRADSVTSDKNILNVRFVAEAAAAKSNFLALYTAYRDKPAKASCEPDEYDCEDATCISGKLRCNGKVNCRFRWDEDECPKEDEEDGMGSKHIIIIMVIFSLILCGMCTAFLFKCIRKLVQDHRTIQENIRESREFRLDELGRKSTKTPEDISRKHSKKRSPTPDPHVGMDHTMLADSISCYIPTETLIPIPIRASEPMLAHINGEKYQRSVYPMTIGTGMEDRATDPQEHHEEETEEAPDTCDIACQTRESLFRPQQSLNGNGDEPRFSTFGYESNRSTATQQRRPPRYTAEAVIEMEQVARSTANTGTSNTHPHPHQREATRSAPDVIIMASSNTNASLSH